MSDAAARSTPPRRGRGKPSTLYLVRLSDGWQLQYGDGTPFGAGLFQQANLARHWARSRGWQVEERSP